MKEVFEDLYRREVWGKGKGSGTGSSPSYCSKLAGHIQELIDSKEWGTFLDLGCGDWQWTQILDWEPIDYIGVEVATPVYERTKAQWTSSTVQFINEDFSNMDVLLHRLDSCGSDPKIVFLKDVVQHWPDDKIHDLIMMIEAQARPGDVLMLANNWRYIRKPRPIPVPRVLDQWHWCPINLMEGEWKQYGFREALYYPRREKMVVRRDW